MYLHVKKSLFLPNSPHQYIIEWPDWWQFWPPWTASTSLSVTIVLATRSKGCFVFFPVVWAVVNCQVSPHEACEWTKCQFVYIKIIFIQRGIKCLFLCFFLEYLLVFCLFGVFLTLLFPSVSRSVSSYSFGCFSRCPYCCISVSLFCFCKETHNFLLISYCIVHLILL